MSYRGSRGRGRRGARGVAHRPRAADMNPYEDICIVKFKLSNLIARYIEESYLDPQLGGETMSGLDFLHYKDAICNKLPIVYTKRVHDMVCLQGLLKETVNVRHILTDIINESYPPIHNKKQKEEIEMETISKPISSLQIKRKAKEETDITLVPSKKWPKINPISLRNNPDFNVDLKGLTNKFKNIARNQELLRICTPVTIDLYSASITKEAITENTSTAVASHENSETTFVKPILVKDIKIKLSTNSVKNTQIQSETVHNKRMDEISTVIPDLSKCNDLIYKEVNNDISTTVSTTPQYKNDIINLDSDNECEEANKDNKETKRTKNCSIDILYLTKELGETVKYEFGVYGGIRKKSTLLNIVKFTSTGEIITGKVALNGGLHYSVMNKCRQISAPCVNYKGQPQVKKSSKRKMMSLTYCCWYKKMKMCKNLSNCGLKNKSLKTLIGNHECYNYCTCCCKPTSLNKNCEVGTENQKCLTVTDDEEELMQLLNNKIDETILSIKESCDLNEQLKNCNDDIESTLITITENCEAHCKSNEKDRPGIDEKLSNGKKQSLIERASLIRNVPSMYRKPILEVQTKFNDDNIVPIVILFNDILNNVTEVYELGSKPHSKIIIKEKFSSSLLATYHYVNFKHCEGVFTICCWCKREITIDEIDINLNKLIKTDLLRRKHTCKYNMCKCCCFKSTGGSVFTSFQHNNTQDRLLNVSNIREIVTEKLPTDPTIISKTQKKTSSKLSQMPKPLEQVLISKKLPTSNQLSKPIGSNKDDLQISELSKPVPPVDIIDENTVKCSTEVRLIIDDILNRFKAVKLTINPNGKVAAMLDISTETLSTTELEFLVKIVNYAQEQVSAMNLKDVSDIRNLLENLSRDPTILSNQSMSITTESHLNNTIIDKSSVNVNENIIPTNRDLDDIIKSNVIMVPKSAGSDTQKFQKVVDLVANVSSVEPLVNTNIALSEYVPNQIPAGKLQELSDYRSSRETVTLFSDGTDVEIINNEEVDELDPEVLEISHIDDDPNAASECILGL